MKLKPSKFEEIRNTVKQIPYGKVATYSQIAQLTGIKDVRMVGWAIKGNKDPQIPCWRVVKADGGIPTNYSKADWREQKYQLVSEGIGFTDDTKVDLDKYLWKKK